MGFVLKVSKGAGAGGEFALDQKEARLGRTADNDIVVKDSGASRSHARVYQKGLRYFVEDLQSANGTKVNNALINAPKEIKTGDTITIGEITFNFRALDETLMAPPEPAAGSQTLIKNFDDDGEPAGASTAEFEAPPRNDTSEVETVEPSDDPASTMLRPPPPSRSLNDQERSRMTRRTGPQGLRDEGTMPPSSRRSQPMAAIEKASDNGTMEVAVPPPAALRRSLLRDEPEEVSAMTAADKARHRRRAQQTTAGRLAYQWSELSLVARLVVGVVGTAFLTLTIGFFAWQFWPRKAQTAGPEPTELYGGGDAIEGSIGLGEGITWERADMKVFTFTPASPTQVVAVLHYQARDISKDEVSISLNGVDLGFVAPDTIDVANRELEQVLPAQHIKLHEQNQLAFDNVRNPPGEDPWRIWNLWLEIVAVPQLSREETLNSVREDIERAQKSYDMRDIGPENLFKAWKFYRDAWLKMEAMPSHPDELYAAARAQQREMAQLLDKKCSTLQLEVQKALAARRPDRKRAREVVDDMLRYFPTREHRCNGLAHNLMEEFGGPGALAK